MIIFAEFTAIFNQIFLSTSLSGEYIGTGGAQPILLDRIYSTEFKDTIIIWE